MRGIGWLVLGFGLAIAFAASSSEAQAQSAPASRMIVTKGADYPGFDYQTIKNVDQDACAKSCTDDKTCKAFTYNTKARWCFLKSDFGLLAASPDANAGRVTLMKPFAKGLDEKRMEELSFLGPGPFDEAKQQAGGLAKDFPPNGLGYDAIRQAAANAVRSGTMPPRSRLSARSSPSHPRIRPSGAPSRRPGCG